MLVWLLLGCESEGKLSASPQSIDWGEVNFRSEMPEEGYDVRTVILKNTGESPVNLVIGSMDINLVCLQGFSDIPADLGSLSPGNSYTIAVAVCDYIPEQGTDTQLSGSIQIDHDGENDPFMIPWTFTPVMEFSDTGTP